MRINKKSSKNKLFVKILKIVIAVSGSFLLLFTAYYGTLKYAYPIKYEEMVNIYSTTFGVDKTLIYATIKVESNFNENAKSSKGATGLMQITDQTAEYISSMLGEKDYNLLDYKTNIRYGTFYLKYLLLKFENENTAICAYNAGEGNVSAWLKDKRYSTNQRTLIAVPFEETKAYLEKINKAIKKYNKLYPKIVDKTNIIE